MRVNIRPLKRRQTGERYLTPSSNCAIVARDIFGDRSRSIERCPPLPGSAS